MTLGAQILRNRLEKLQRDIDLRPLTCYRRIVRTGLLQCCLNIWLAWLASYFAGEIVGLLHTYLFALMSSQACASELKLRRRRVLDTT